MTPTNGRRLGSLSPFHRRAAYGHTVENSVYVHPDHQRERHRQGHARRA